jgi:hypothetical protein
MAGTIARGGRGGHAACGGARIDEAETLMMAAPPLAWLLAGALLAAPLGARADTYKWTDERGVTTYGGKPPAGARNVRRVDINAGTLSIVPAPPRREAPPPVVRLEAPLPGALDQAAAAEADRRARWREQCIAERRVDCNAPTAATFDFAQSHAPR